jgi:hypothetical protein
MSAAHPLSRGTAWVGLKSLARIYICGITVTIEMIRIPHATASLIGIDASET